jgi:hypothetical protein
LDYQPPDDGTLEEPVPTIEEAVIDLDLLELEALLLPAELVGSYYMG